MAEKIVIISLSLLLYAYILYPTVMIIGSLLVRKRKFEIHQDLPTVSVIMALHNEEEVIGETLEALLRSDYPADRIEVLTGSDNSTDRTNEILTETAQRYSGLVPLFFDRRMGKPAIINKLAERANGEILIISDADIRVDPDTIRELVRPFTGRLTGLTEPLFKRDRIRETGVALQELTYLGYESLLKKAESEIFGFYPGVSGGFYALRRELYAPVPEHFLVDDFYISMNVAISGYHTIITRKSLVYETIPNHPDLHFRRKNRIAAGNFQNLFHFARRLVMPFNRIFIPFLSHKVLRWAGPFLFIILFIFNLFMLEASVLFQLLFLIQLILIILPPLDILLSKAGINLVPLRFITHFALMNIALITGFFQFVGGIKSGIWEPTKRFKNE
ncbi:MAG: glycosyltransferase [Bacteroidales bacterium]|nr:glycosyltransferase [Bacteroidales bacterium]